MVNTATKLEVMIMVISSDNKSYPSKRGLYYDIEEDFNVKALTLQKLSAPLGVCEFGMPNPTLSL